MTSYGRNKNRDDEIKNIAGQVLTYNSKNFHWLNEKVDLEQTTGELGKLFLKKIQIKKTKIPQINVKMPLAKTKNH